MRAATVVQVLQDLFYGLLQLFVVAAIILSFKLYCKFYCMFYFTGDRSLRLAGLVRFSLVSQHSAYLLISLYLYDLVTEDASASEGEERCWVLHICCWTDAAVLVCCD